MLRRSHILAAVAVLVACAALVPSAYAVYPPGAFAGDGQSPPPPSSIAVPGRRTQYQESTSAFRRTRGTLRKYASR